jgi:outer membrane protein OmpA-like peptidoglycan-associated protein
MRLKETLLGTMAAIAMTGAAQADYVSPTGWYMSLGAGANWLEDGDMQSFYSGTFTDAWTYSYSQGYIVSGSVGYDFGDHWRVEFEVAYRDNDADKWVYTDGRGAGTTDAEVSEFSQMVNVLYDFQLGGNWEATVGAGIGGNLVTWNWGDPQYDDYVFAGQLIAGAAYQFADRWKAFADYRYMIMDDPDFKDLDDPLYNYTIEKTDHSVLVGLRFDLQRDGAAPPPRHTSPGSPKQFIVFFGFNKSNLTSEAARVVSEAAAAAKQYGSASITVVGHTDTVGSNDYNLRLSMARSQSVKEGLIGNGIAASMISTGGRGEAELMVQTGDAVKEPQNRRATIDLN